jgi:hypothetical protein
LKESIMIMFTRVLARLVLLVAGLGPCVTPAWADDSVDPGYVLGRGWRLGDTGLTAGGYSALQYQRTPDGVTDSHLSLSHASLFLWWENEAGFKLFMEVDKQDAHPRGPVDADGNHSYLSVERLYVDYTINDSLTLRAGKYLTPIGRWNQVHADPLVWTTSRPLITRNLFPDNATGAMALGNIELDGHAADYALYVSPGRGLRPDPEQDAFSRGYGARLNVALDEHLHVGASLASFVQSARRSENKRLFGVDFLWVNKGVEMSGEAAHRDSSDGKERAEYGGFVQLVIPLRGALSAVTRIESLHEGEDEGLTRQALVGLTYRASRAVSFKVEALKQRRGGARAPIDILSSISVLF